MTGAKAGAGSTRRRRRDPDAGSADAGVPAEAAAKLPSLEAARAIEATAERIRALYEGKDKVGAFLRATLGPTLEYAEQIADEIAYSRDDIDKAMRWGFGWELGPFETLRRSANSGDLTTPNSQRQRPTLRAPSLNRSSRRRPRQNAGASLIDLGDGVLQVEFHSKMNAIGGDTIQMLQAGVQGSVAELRRARRRQRRAELFRRRQPDAAAARGAGGQLGRESI